MVLVVVAVAAAAPVAVAVAVAVAPAGAVVVAAAAVVRVVRGMTSCLHLIHYCDLMAFAPFVISCDILFYAGI